MADTMKLRALVAIQYTVNDMAIPGTDTEVFEINGHSGSLLVLNGHAVEVVEPKAEKPAGKPAKAGKAAAADDAEL